ncbi:MAG TPA: hypothetical protein VG944_17065 [Fimbriimonas sp.]|nr:hypothetical protein [Fimbriimonas sp.]
MPKWTEGQRVRVVTRPVTEDDRKRSRYFEHMGGLTGTIQNVYEDGEVAVQVETVALGKVTSTVHKTATERMREKFQSNATEEQRKALTKEEMDFNTHYVLLVSEKDLEKA